MKIMIVNRHMDTTLGGSEIQCDLISRNLTKMGNEIVYIAVGSQKVTEHLYTVVPEKNLTFFSFLRNLKKYKPDVIYWRYNKKKLLKCVLAAKIQKVKFVYSLSHVNDVTKYVSDSVAFSGSIIHKARQYLSNVKTRIISRINYSAISWVDGVVSLQECLLELLPRGFLEGNSSCIYNSMEYKPSIDFSRERPYVVWVANIKPPKRPELYIQLAKEFEDRNVDFLMIGAIQDPSYDYILDKANLPKNLVYLGPKPVHEVDAIMKNALMMIHTCVPEGFGNNFIQAWYSAIPTLTVSFDPDNLIQKNEIGHHTSDYAGLKERVAYLLEHDEVRTDMGDRAKKIANDLFVPEHNAKKLEDFLKTIVY